MNSPLFIYSLVGNPTPEEFVTLDFCVDIAPAGYPVRVEYKNTVNMGVVRHQVYYYTLEEGRNVWRSMIRSGYKHTNTRAAMTAPPIRNHAEVIR